VVESRQHVLERATSVAVELLELVVGDRPLPGLGLGLRHPGQRVGGQELLLRRPREHGVRGLAGVVHARRPPPAGVAAGLVPFPGGQFVAEPILLRTAGKYAFLRLHRRHPGGDVVGLQLAGQHLTAVLGEELAVILVPAVRVAWFRRLWIRNASITSAFREVTASGAVRRNFRSSANFSSARRRCSSSLGPWINLV
jgi:hypothetical protein